MPFLSQWSILSTFLPTVLSVTLKPRLISPLTSTSLRTSNLWDNYLKRRAPSNSNILLFIEIPQFSSTGDYSIVSIYPTCPCPNLPVQGCISDFSTCSLYFNQIQPFPIPTHPILITWMNKWINVCIISPFYFLFLVLFLSIHFFSKLSSVTSNS